MDLEERIYNATTLIECSYNNIQTQGTGFYFSNLEDKGKNIKSDEYIRVLDIWLITNRHVALPMVNNQEIVPDFLIFNLRQRVNDKIEWVPIVLNKTEFILVKLL